MGSFPPKRKKIAQQKNKNHHISVKQFQMLSCFVHAFNSKRLTSSCYILRLIDALSYDLTIDYFLSFEAVVINLTAA